MSLFEQSDFRWRETYFVLFQAADRPTAEAARAAIRGLGDRFDVREVQPDDQGRLESLSIRVRGESSAMDVVYVGDEDVTEQLPELISELRHGPDGDTCGAQIEALADATARLDVLHFQMQLDNESEDDLDDYIDPGSLLVVLECLCQLCHGIAVDPQSASFVATD
jgi:hypothetical protein